MNMNELFKELYAEKFGNKITRPLAESIVEDMAVTDGTTRPSGEKWTYEEAVEMGNKMNIDWNKTDKCEWYLVANMNYSDHFRTAKKHGLSENFFFDLTFDWFHDVDAEENKTFNYFIHL